MKKMIKNFIDKRFTTVFVDIDDYSTVLFMASVSRLCVCLVHETNYEDCVAVTYISTKRRVKKFIEKLTEEEIEFTTDESYCS